MRRGYPDNQEMTMTSIEMETNKLKTQYNEMFKAAGNAQCEFEFFNTRISNVYSFTFRCIVVSSVLTLAFTEYKVKEYK